MKDKLLLFFYLFLLIFVSFLHSIGILFFVFMLILAVLSFSPLKVKEKLRILRRSFFSVFFFSIFVSLPYVFIGFLIGENRFNYFLMVNLRAFDLTVMTFTFLELVNLFKALDFSKNLSLLLVLVSSHSISYIKVLKDFTQAFKSRSPKNGVRGEDLKNYLTRVVSYFFEKSMETSEEIYIAMKSRGLYHD